MVGGVIVQLLGYDRGTFPPPRPPRRRRSVGGVANATLLGPPTAPPNASLPHLPDDEPGEDEQGKVELFVYSKESALISNLRHFTSYQIEIHACNHPTDPSRCSMAAYVSARTMPEGSWPVPASAACACVPPRSCDLR